MSTDSPDAVAAAFVAAVNAQDLEAALELWTDDAIFIAAEGSPLVGRDAIRGLLTGLTSSGTKIHYETATTYVAGETAVRVGRLKLISANAPDNASELAGDYVTVCRRQTTGWRLAIDAPFGFPANLPD
jgi:uncharacterized protein (TIGR02246 family)